MSTQIAIIFDLDGVLINTVEAHYAAWSAVAAELNTPFSEADNNNLRGVRRKDALAYLARRLGPLDNEKQEYLLWLKAVVYQQEVKKAGDSIRIDGVDRLLSALRELNIPIGLASASKHAPMLLDLARLTGLIDVVSDGNFAGELKPYPGQLLHVARCLNVEPAECTVVEDSAVGLEAARRAGMRSIAVGDVPLVTANGTSRLKSLANVNLQDFLKTVGANSFSPHQTANV